jgi:hypothetical protein
MNIPQPAAVITTGLALLAFIVAFYVLLARERKIPYITNFVFPPAALIILATFFGFIEQLLMPNSLQVAPVIQSGISLSRRFREISSAVAAWLAVVCLAVGIAVTLSHIWRLHNRQVHFRDDHRVKNTRFVRWVKRQLRQLRARPTFEHSPIGVDVKEVAGALAVAGFSGIPEGLADLRTIAICKQPLRATDVKIATLCRELIAHEWYVQYTTCIRHPLEFVQVLKSAFGNKWAEYARKIIVVDAYSPHFGFTDSIHEVKSLQLTAEGIRNIPARDSYAGVHTANARAFNILKSLGDPNPPRKPALLLYEGANALSDLESMEQYRIFARHVLTSERMWGGMLTFFVEPTILSAEMDVLKTYCDLFQSVEMQDGKSL